MPKERIPEPPAPPHWGFFLERIQVNHIDARTNMQTLTAFLQARKTALYRQQERAVRRGDRDGVAALDHAIRDIEHDLGLVTEALDAVQRAWEITSQAHPYSHESNRAEASQP